MEWTFNLQKINCENLENIGKYLHKFVSEQSLLKQKQTL